MDNEFVVYAYEHYAPELNRFATALAGNSFAGEDLVQEAFTRLAAETMNGSAPANTRAWLYRVTRNLHVSNCRRSSVAAGHADAVERSHEVISKSAEDEVLLHERDAELRRLLDGLDELDRSSLVMAALGYSGAEIGRRIGRNENAVRVRLHRARTRLRSELVALGSGMAAG